MDRIDEKIIEAYDKITQPKLDEGKLTKKDFNGLAGILKSAQNIDQLKSNIVDWASTMNPMFNAEQFKKTAGINEENLNEGNKEYLHATKNILDAWNRFNRIYFDEQMEIFANKEGKTASSQFMKLRDKIANAFTAMENLLAKHYQMASKLK